MITLDDATQARVIELLKATLENVAGLSTIVKEFTPSVPGPSPSLVTQAYDSLQEALTLLGER
jgi:hypothetical protein